MNQKLKMFQDSYEFGSDTSSRFYFFFFYIHDCCELGCEHAASPKHCSAQRGSIIKEQELICDPSDVYMLCTPDAVCHGNGDSLSSE